MKKEKLLLIIAILAVIFAFFYYSRNTNDIEVSPTESPASEDQQLSNLLMVTFDEQYADGIEYKYVDGKTVFDILQEYSKESGLDLKTKEYDFGVFIEAIGDYENTEERVWIYYVNESSGDVAADKYELEDGDFIEWKYQEPIY